MAPIGTFYGAPTQRQSVIVRSVAAITGQELIIPEFKMGVTNKAPEFLARFPAGKIPAFEDSDGFLLTEGATIAHYLASLKPESGLIGRDVKEEAAIGQWVHFAETDIQPNIETIYYFIVGYASGYSPEFSQWLYNRAIIALNQVEKYLSDGGREYLVGGRLTVADLTVAAVVQFALRVILGKAEREALPRTIAHLERIVGDARLKGEFPPQEYLEVRLDGSPLKKD
ncbi:glutathione S-transferase C-terminal-like protein [Coniophora puteana RWD-64-598 SS2]|uniref:Glutathione S-transferase C-terminal-like protein n=1 Tax=Coniophora puteana (strain RWD-64-598) TaxID=741705 RepID=A0A5M3MCD5_CONPW|nr:glutathione S-transferase C-terminal-like protein [Coniophora puteana RWD-64-598 SS2]EIW76564.1 glutathione S-transferase C-terminal-like protein [Coniophora puteana RWD-64-598 SS2]